MAIREDGRNTTQAQKEAAGKSFDGSQILGKQKQKEEKPNTDSQLDPSSIAKQLDDNQNLTDNERDGLKYRTAVNMARQHFANDEDVDNKRMREYIDEQYSAMNPTQNGSQIRGENAIGNFIRDTSEGWKGAMNGLGNIVDGAWDTAIGGGLDALGWHDAADTARGLTDGRTIGTGLDIASDIGLAFIPGVGPALAIGKAAADNMGNLDEAIKGYDTTTLENLSDDQRFAKGLGAIANTALAGLPGAGKLYGGAKALTGIGKAESAATKTAQEAVGDYSKAVDALSDARKGTQAARKAGDEKSLASAKKIYDDAAKATEAAEAPTKEALANQRAIQAQQKALGSKESFREAGQVAKQNLADGTYTQRIKDAYNADPNATFLNRMASGIKAANPRANLLTDASGSYKGPMRGIDEYMTDQTAQKGLKEIASDVNEAAASKAAKGAAEADKAITEAGGKAAEKGVVNKAKSAAKSAAKAPGKLSNAVEKKLRITNTGNQNGFQRALGLAGNFAANSAVGGLNYMGEYGDDLFTNIGRYYGDLSRNPSAAIGMAAAPGSAKIGSRLGSLRGYKTPSRAPQNAIRAASGGIVAQDMLGQDTGAYISDEDQQAQLDQLSQVLATMKRGA